MGEPYFYEDGDLDGDPEMKRRRYELRSGSSPSQRTAILRAKATLAFMREHPGCTRIDFRIAGIKPNFAPLVRHRLAYWAATNGHRAFSVDFAEHTRWFPVNGSREIGKICK